MNDLLSEEIRLKGKTQVFKPEFEKDHFFFNEKLVI